MLGLLVLTEPLVATTGGTLTGRVTNTNSTSSATYARTTCLAAARATGSAFFLHALDEGSPATVAADSSTNLRPGTYRNTGNITYRVTGAPCVRDNGRAITLRGTDAAAGHLVNTTPVVNPQEFTASVWFRTTTSTGGKLIGFGNAAAGLSGQYDRHIYMTNSGNLVAGVYDGTVNTVTSPATYRDNVWHHVAMTLAPSDDANPGLRLYVDGALVAFASGVTAAEAFTGYWRLGWDNLASWTNVPTRQSFAGSLDFAAVFSSALTPAQVASLDDAGS